jgi:hypothetical protein
MMTEGLPNLEIQPEMRASVQEMAAISFRGIASRHLADLSIAVKM